MSFDSAFERTVGLEGGYSNNPNDRGGPTKFGITERVARANGYSDDMALMPLAVAKTIYKGQYWDTLKLDQVSGMSAALADELFDTAVNMGVGTAGRFLQRALNVFNRGGRDYGDLTVDGVLGAVTVEDLRVFLSKRGMRGEAVLLSALNAQQGVRYIEIAEKDASQEDFEFGWWDKRVA